MYIFIAAFLLLTTNIFAQEYEKINNTLLLKAIDIIKKDPDQTNTIKELEEAYKKNIENDILDIASNLPKDLKALLGNFETKFSKFKKKIELIKNYYNTENSKVIFLHSDFILVTLGLKPVSVCIQLKNNPFHNLVNFINQHFDSELSYGEVAKPDKEYEDLYRNGPQDYILCYKPFFDPDFVKACYQYSKESENFLYIFTKILESTNKEELTKFLTFHWHNIDELPKDNLAYILGYVPCDYYGIEDKIHFRMRLIPGVHDSIRTTYVRLYEKLIEYETVSLLGIHYYLKLLNNSLLTKDFEIEKEYYAYEQYLSGIEDLLLYLTKVS